MAEKLSTIERAWEADDVRRAPLRVLSAADVERARQRAAAATQLHFEATARELPVSLFKNDEEIQRLTREAEAWRIRVERLGRANCRADLLNVIPQLEKQIADLQQEMRTAAVDDALEGALHFPRAIEVARKDGQLRAQLSAARLALEVFMKPAPERDHFNADEDRARVALQNALVAKQREYLRAHPELLTAPGGGQSGAGRAQA